MVRFSNAITANLLARRDYRPGRLKRCLQLLGQLCGDVLGLADREATAALTLEPAHFEIGPKHLLELARQHHLVMEILSRNKWTRNRNLGRLLSVMVADGFCSEGHRGFTDCLMLRSQWRPPVLPFGSDSHSNSAAT